MSATSSIWILMRGLRGLRYNALGSNYLSRFVGRPDDGSYDCEVRCVRRAETPTFLRGERLISVSALRPQLGKVLGHAFRASRRPADNK